MLTIFSIPGPEPFTEKIRRSRKNAINSWRRLRPKCEILLFGDGPEVSEFAVQANIQHVQNVSRTEYGTPLLDDVFGKAQNLAMGDVLMFSNCDMLYFDDLYDVIEAVNFKKFMVCGRRWDMEVDDEMALQDEEAWGAIKDAHHKHGQWHGPSGLDYFIFPKVLKLQIPAFAVGRPGWDSWLIWKMRQTGVSVIDSTGALTAIHQNHDYRHLRLGTSQYSGPEMRRNKRLAGGYRNMLTLREADWVISQRKVVRPPWPRRIFSLLGPTLPYRLILAAKRCIKTRTRSNSDSDSRALQRT